MDAGGAHGKHFERKVGDLNEFFVIIHALGWSGRLLRALFQYFAGIWKGSAAEVGSAEGGGGKPPELLQVSYQQSSTPCYLCGGAAD